MPSQTQLFSKQSGFGGINQQFARRPLEDLLRWTMWTFGDRVAQVTSFGPPGMVILDHLVKLNPDIRVMTIDTSFLFPETYELWEDIEKRYLIQIEVRRSTVTPLMQAREYGHQLWDTDPDHCCQIRKVVPLRTALQDMDAWITGIRRDQAPSRANTPLIGWDHGKEMVKINPLAHWSRTQVWRYIHEHDLPYNRLHDRGYSSIGCAQCTKPSTIPDDERSGRWSGQQKVECGIHL
ncbi:phosphoadenylyl-sulfate reductase [Chloroflexi bacterium TSY]|nr:phosphoadenylyl-sulfate reductase [Chloroflexi bacterium TSY]